MKKMFLTACAVTAVLCSSPLVFGQTWTEVGDAGEHPIPVGDYQDTVGVGPLTNIIGSTSDPDFFDAYSIRITDPDWSMQANGFDTRLWLFDTDGNFLMSNDDNGQPGNVAGLTSVANWPNAINALNIPPIDPTVGDKYVLVVGGWAPGGNNVANLVDASGTIMSMTGGFTDLNGLNPNFVGAPSAGTWVGGGTGDYDIQMSGVGFCAIPEPASTSLLALGVMGLAFVRKRKRA